MSFSKLEKLSILEGCLKIFLAKPREYSNEILETLIKISVIDSEKAILLLTDIMSKYSNKIVFNFYFLFELGNSINFKKRSLSELLKVEPIRKKYLKKEMFQVIAECDCIDYLIPILSQLTLEGDFETTHKFLLKINRYQQHEIGYIVEEVIRRIGVNVENQQLFLKWRRVVKNRSIKKEIKFGEYEVSNFQPNPYYYESLLIELDLDEFDFFEPEIEIPSTKEELQVVFNEYLINVCERNMFENWCIFELVLINSSQLDGLVFLDYLKKMVNLIYNNADETFEKFMLERLFREFNREFSNTDFSEKIVSLIVSDDEAFNLLFRYSKVIPINLLQLIAQSESAFLFEKTLKTIKSNSQINFDSVINCLLEKCITNENHLIFANYVFELDDQFIRSRLLVHLIEFL